jgi:hypothetical protein
MADFSALCPLFSTGVYNDVKIYDGLVTTARSTTTRFGIPPFGRSVIVTAAYIAKLTTFAATCTALKIALLRAASWSSATRTIFATFNLSATAATQICRKPLAFTIASAKTFSATQVLQLKFLKKEGGGAKTCDVWLRYKEK